MDINEIEYKIACNELNAAQVFTQMKQHINIESKWTNIKNEQPEQVQGSVVLGHNGSYAFECEFDNGDWCSIGGDEMTHWMHLTPPEEV